MKQKKRKEWNRKESWKESIEWNFRLCNVFSIASLGKHIYHFLSDKTYTECSIKQILEISLIRI